jgi:hypothetical protein
MCFPTGDKSPGYCHMSLRDEEPSKDVKEGKRTERTERCDQSRVLSPGAEFYFLAAYLDRPWLKTSWPPHPIFLLLYFRNRRPQYVVVDSRIILSHAMP